MYSIHCFFAGLCSYGKAEVSALFIPAVICSHTSDFWQQCEKPNKLQTTNQPTKPQNPDLNVSFLSGVWTVVIGIGKALLHSSFFSYKTEMRIPLNIMQIIDCLHLFLLIHVSQQSCKLAKAIAQHQKNSIQSSTVHEIILFMHATSKDYFLFQNSAGTLQHQKENQGNTPATKVYCRHCDMQLYMLLLFSLQF